jgi:hypothetical protein
MGNYLSKTPKHALGTYFHGSAGDIWRYVKVGKFYFWHACSGMAVIMHATGHHKGC